MLNRLLKVINSIIDLSKQGKTVSNSWIETSEIRTCGNLKFDKVIISSCGGNVNIFVVTDNDAEIKNQEDYLKFLKNGGQLFNVVGRPGAWDKTIEDNIGRIEEEINQKSVLKIEEKQIQKLIDSSSDNSSTKVGEVVAESLKPRTLSFTPSPEEQKPEESYLKKLSKRERKERKSSEEEAD